MATLQAVGSINESVPVIHPERGLCLVGSREWKLLLLLPWSSYYHCGWRLECWKIISHVCDHSPNPGILLQPSILAVRALGSPPNWSPSNPPPLHSSDLSSRVFIPSAHHPALETTRGSPVPPGQDQTLAKVRRPSEMLPMAFPRWGLPAPRLQPTCVALAHVATVNVLYSFPASKLLYILH